MHVYNALLNGGNKESIYLGTVGGRLAESDAITSAQWSTMPQVPDTTEKLLTGMVFFNLCPSQ